MDTTPTVTPVPAWDDLTTAQRFQYAGNLDPWAGPVDPVAQERQLRRWKATQARATRQEQEDNTCGCWMPDCADCGARLADGKRPAKGAVARWWKRVQS